MMAQWVTEATQQRRKFWHDKHLRRMEFRPGQWVLKYNSRNEIKPGKFKVRWLGPYKVQEAAENGAIKLSTLDDQPIKETVNGSKLKMYKTAGSSEMNQFVRRQGLTRQIKKVINLFLVKKKKMRTQRTIVLLNCMDRRMKCQKSYDGEGKPSDLYD